MKKLKTDPVKTVLTISMGFLVIYLGTKWSWAIIVSLVIGSIGIFSDYLSIKVNFLWMKLTWLLSLVVPFILLSVIFYLFLFPIAILSKLFGKKDEMILKNRLSSTFMVRDKSFDKSTFEKVW